MLPTGTVTFLFSDIEGSTTLWEQAPEAMQSMLQWHDRVLRSAIESSGGHVVKTTGDGAYAVFGTAKDAVAACVRAQRNLQARAIEASSPGAQAAEESITIRVRMGLHSGAAELRDGDYFGPSLNRAARIMSVAYGEQVLISATTAELVRGELPEGVTLRETGEHRLRGLPNPERLLQLLASGLRADFPPLASQAGHSLPAERDAFVGRSDALAELTGRMRGDARLISVLGIGGTGKTRLVTRFGWSALDAFPGGVWFCDLSEARSVDGIFHVVAQGLGIPLGGDEPVTRIGNAIAGRGQCLVILDNFEQVARHAEETLGRWMTRASAARFVVTTREVLGLQGQEILALGPLPPQEAAALFIKRAETARPGFALSAEDSAAIGQLAKLLEGLPLAIELAAARVRVMPPRTLLTRMNDRFKLLASMGGRVGRQATLRAVFDWSWDLLSPPEKAALAQLSVFEGGFTLEAVEALLDLDGYDDAPWPIDVLQSLVQKSLVRQVSDERFDLLASVHEYAAEHLRTPGRYGASGPDAVLSAEIRHGAYFAGLGLENLVVASRRAVARADAGTATGALRGAWTGLALRGPFAVAVELASRVQAMPGLNPANAAVVHWVAGSALVHLRKVADARAALEIALDSSREASDRAVECQALLSLSSLETRSGRAKAGHEHLDRALGIARDLGDCALQGAVELALGNLQIHLGKPDTAVPHYEEALALAKKARDAHLETTALSNLGTIEVSGRHRARRYCEAALAVARENADRVIECNTLCNLGLLDYYDERFDEARERLEMALALAREIGAVETQSIVLCNLAMVHDALADLDAAENEYGAALAIARESGLRRMEGQILGYLGVLYARRGKFDEARRSLDAGEALLRAVSDPVSLGLLLCNRAEVQQLAGASAGAKDALAAVEQIAGDVAAGADSELNLALARLRRVLQ